MSFDKMKRLYMQGAIILLNTVVLLLLLDAVCYVTRSIRHRFGPGPGPVAAYGKARVLQGHPGQAEADVLAMLHETEEVGGRTEYEVLIEFKEAPFRGRYVNVDPAGFRAGKPQGPWPPDPANFNIFVFGGSTTFGYGVSDGETIPVAIQELLSKTSTRPVFVYNFGCVLYFSTQELMLYYSLLMKGSVPRVAIFLDGLNDFYFLTGELGGTAELKSLVQKYGWDDDKGNLRSFLVNTSLGRAARWLRKRAERRRTEEPGPQADDEAALARVRDRWLTNKNLIEELSALFHVRPLFVWQPVPTYRYDHARYHLLRDWGDKPLKSCAPSPSAYALVQRSRAALEQGNNFLWLADIQEERRENLYVDEVHYTAAFSKDIAAYICAFLGEKGYLADATEKGPSVSAIPTLGGPQTPSPADSARR